MPPLPERAGDELTRRLHLQIERLTGRVVDLAAEAWSALDNYDEANVRVFTELIERIIGPAQVQVITASSAYTSTLAGVPPVGLSPSSVAIVPPDIRQAFTATWHRIGSEEESFERAVDAGRSQLTRTLKTHLIRSSRTAVGAAADRGRFPRQGWKRTLTAKSCEWCAMVANQVYRTADTADFGHGRCDCGVRPLFELPATGQYLDPELAKNLDAYRVVERNADRRRAQRTEQAAENASARRDRLLLEARTERDPDRRLRLIDRARRADADSLRLSARAAEERAVPIGSMDGSTGYVDPSGAPIARP